MKAPTVSETPLHDSVAWLRDYAEKCDVSVFAKKKLKLSADELERMYELNLELTIDRLQGKR